MKNKRSYSKKFKSKRPWKKVKVSKHYYPNKPVRRHKSWGNAYIDNNGNYKEKPYFANFWKEGFLTDVPVRKDYNRIMDGVVHTDSIIDRSQYRTEEEYRRAIKNEEHDHLYGLERMQISIARLWNGSLREWIKLFVRILIPNLFVLAVLGACDLFVGTSYFG